MTQGERTTAGSKMLDNYVPPYDATAVERLEAPAQSCWARRTATSSPWVRRTKTPRSGRCGIRGTWSAFPADRAADRRRRWLREWPWRALGTRHRRLDSPAGIVLRRRRADADLWAGLALRPGRLRLLARPHRPFGAVGARCRGRARRDRRARPAGFDLAPTSPVPDYARSSAETGERAARRRAARVLRRGARRRRERSASRPGSRCSRSWAAEIVAHVAAAHRVRRGALLHPRAPPRPARTWRAMTACATASARPAQLTDGDVPQDARPTASATEVKRRIMLGTYALSAPATTTPIT